MEIEKNDGKEEENLEEKEKGEEWKKKELQRKIIKIKKKRNKNVKFNKSL